MVKAERMGFVAIQATNEDGLERVLRVQISRITTGGESFLELCLCSICDNSNNWNPHEYVSFA